MNKKILLIGSKGFLGSRVKDLATTDNYEIIEITGKSHVDITDLKLFQKFLKDREVDCIINCAAFVGGISFGYKYQADLLKINSLMAANIYEVANQYNIPQVINPISNCAYPGHLRLYKEDDFWNGAPHSSVFNYALSKRLYVALGQSFFEQYGVSSNNVILSNMYGPGDHFEEERSHALGALVKKIVTAKLKNLDTVTIWGSGKPIREWLYVDDGAKSLIKSTSLKPGNFLYNIGINKGSTITEIAKLISREVSWEGKLIFDTSKPDGVMEKKVDGSYGKSLLNWEPEVKLESGIKKTVDWYMNNYGE